ncbi:MAG: hypothetical protein HQK75_03785 [Candidatus Magnetomorum sp.]|nr:hypothetical protein [Candidatus Magnetomorum sp.]
MHRKNISINVMEQVFGSLNLSKEILLNEMAIILAHQQLSEYKMKNDYYEKKYKKIFNSFDKDFRQTIASYDVENDWMSWKFAIESMNYWQDILAQI